jgi:hypothetical protein
VSRIGTAASAPYAPPVTASGKFSPLASIASVAPGRSETTLRAIASAVSYRVGPWKRSMR